VLEIQDRSQITGNTNKGFTCRSQNNPGIYDYVRNI